MMKIYTPGGGGGGGGSPVWTPTDSSDFINWRLNEAAGATTFASSINAGASTNLTIGTTSKFASGVSNGSFQNVVAFQGDADSGERFLRGAETLEPSDKRAYSVSFWMKPYSWIPGRQPIVFGKLWNPGATWSWPNYVSVYFGYSSPTELVSLLHIYGLGNASLITPITVGEIALISLTYDGNFVKLYKNGALIQTSGDMGGRDAYFASGWWFAGKAPVNFPGHSYDGEIWDIRMANTVRSQAYYASMYDAGT
jgi:hypothetical protein